MFSNLNLELFSHENMSSQDPENILLNFYGYLKHHENLCQVDF